MKELQFIPASASDLSSVYTLYQSVLCRPFCVWNENYPGWNEIHGDFSVGNLFLLTQNGSLLGAISIVPEKELDHLPYWRIRDDSCEIARVVISPSHQGQGLAGFMVQKIIAVLIGRGYKSIHLSVAKSNIPAQKTYEHVGFTAVGEAWLYGHDYLLMEMDLTGI